MTRPLNGEGEGRRKDGGGRGKGERKEEGRGRGRIGGGGGRGGNGDGNGMRMGNIQINFITAICDNPFMILLNYIKIYTTINKNNSNITI